jgi:glycerophosphoryl diester phosphodiesterase
LNKQVMSSKLTPPLIIAHRGASLYAPENTLASFKLAVCQGADGIELDAKLCADGNVVVIHDKTVDRTTSASGKVADMTLEELKKLDAGSQFDVSYKGEMIPTLHEVFEAVGRQIMINIDLTNYYSPFDSLPVKVAEIVSQHNLAHSILFSSFNPIALRRIKHLIPEASIGLIALGGIKGRLMLGWFGRFLIPYQSIHPAIRDVTPNLLNRAHQLGHRVNVYTVNQASDMERLFKMGIDGIFTDDPLLARQVLANISQNN